MIQVLCRLKLIATPTYVAASHTLNEIIDNASYPIEAGESVTGWVGGNKIQSVFVLRNLIDMRLVRACGSEMVHL